MRKASRLLAVLMAALLLFSVAAVGISADRHSAPPSTPPTKTIQKMDKKPTIDGKIDANEGWGAAVVSFSDKNFDEKTGGLWSDKNIDGLTFKPMTPATVNAYMGWDETTFYFALTTQQAKHTNTEHNKLDLWKGDCLQIQISNKEGGTRYEMGFAYSTFGPKNRLAYQWFPLPAKELPNGKKNGYFYADRNESTKTTTYEIALKADMFGGSKLTANSKIPFSFALHLFEESTDPLAESSGCFYEWASGVVGGDLEKDIKQAAVLTLGTQSNSGGNVKPDPTTKPAPTKTNAPEPNKTTKQETNKTNAPGPNKTNAPGPNKTNNQQTNAPINTTVGGGDVTEAPTTTLPDLDEPLLERVLKDLTEVTDEAIVSALAEAADMDSVKVQTGNPDGKFLLVADDFLTVYYLDGEEYKAMDPDTESVEGMFVYENEVGAETVYLVLPADPTTVAPVETTAAADNDNVTTKKVATTAAGSTDDGDSEGGFPVWAIILIVVVVVAGAGVAAFFIIKKKKDGGLQ